MIKEIIIRVCPELIIRRSVYFDSYEYERLYKIPHRKAARHYLTEGYLKGYEPSSSFNGNDYWEANPDTKKMNPLLHYEVYGKKEGRLLRREQEVGEECREVLNCVYEAPQPHGSIKRCAIFASYSSEGIVPEYVVYYLSQLRKEVDGVIFIADNNLKQLSELDKIKPYVTYACFTRHGSYDFGSYRKGIEYLSEQGLLHQLDELYLVNDSCYGPVNGFETVFESMRKRSCDFWGMVDSTDTKYHLLSFFYCFKKRILQDPSFYEFFQLARGHISFDFAVMKLERELTEYLRNLGYSSECFLPSFVESQNLHVIAGNRNATVWPLMLLKAGFPLVKIKALDGRFGDDLREKKDKVLDYIKQVNQQLYRIIVSDLRRRSCISKEDDLLTFYDGVKEKEIISFDIFDTLIIRPFPDPTQLFTYMERKYNIDGFSAKRVDAERRARTQAKNGEVTLEEIYDVMPPMLRKWEQVEKTEEMSLCLPNPAIWDIYHYAVKCNKRIIAISDMYLDSDFLLELLKNKGFKNVEKVYVSSAYKKNKGAGELYLEVLKEEKIRPQMIYHIGDNPTSDINKARSLGMGAYYMEQLFTSFLKLPAKAKYSLFYGAYGKTNIGVGLHMMLLARYYAENRQYSDLKDFGYSMGGPIALSYLTYVCDKAKNNGVDALLFVARDGDVLKKIYDDCFYDRYQIKAEYAYLTRAVSLSATLDFSENHSYLKTILRLISDEVPQIEYTDDYNVNKKIYYKNRVLISEWSNKKRNSIKKHLVNLCGSSGNIAVVDLFSSSFSALKCAVSLLGERVKLGLCIASFFNSTVYPVETFCNNYVDSKYEDDIVLLEKLFSSGEPGIKGINEKGEPVYVRSYSERRKEIYNEIQSGIMAYVRDYIDIIGMNCGVQMSFPIWLEMAEYYRKYANRIDEDMLRKIDYCANPVEVISSDMCSINAEDSKER